MVAKRNVLSATLVNDKALTQAPPGAVGIAHHARSVPDPVGCGKDRGAAEHPRYLELFLWARRSKTPAYVFDTVEIAIAGCLFLGLFRTAAYGAALALHAVSVLVSWRQLLDPLERCRQPFVIAGVPVLGALFLLRQWDRGILDRE